MAKYLTPNYPVTCPSCNSFGTLLPDRTCQGCGRRIPPKWLKRCYMDRRSVRAWACLFLLVGVVIACVTLLGGKVYGPYNAEQVLFNLVCSACYTSIGIGLLRFKFWAWLLAVIFAVPAILPTILLLRMRHCFGTRSER
jgi:hypothetical protein